MTSDNTTASGYAESMVWNTPEEVKIKGKRPLPPHDVLLLAMQRVGGKFLEKTGRVPTHISVHEDVANMLVGEYKVPFHTTLSAFRLTLMNTKQSYPANIWMGIVTPKEDKQQPMIILPTDTQVQAPPTKQPMIDGMNWEAYDEGFDTGTLTLTFSRDGAEYSYLYVPMTVAEEMATVDGNDIGEFYNTRIRGVYPTTKFVGESEPELSGDGFSIFIGYETVTDPTFIDSVMELLVGKCFEAGFDMEKLAIMLWQGQEADMIRAYLKTKDITTVPAFTPVGKVWIGVSREINNG